MTRKSRREIERAVDDLDGGEDGDDWGTTVLHRDPATGDCYRTRDADGDPVDPDAVEGFTVILNREYVMFREQAEAEGKEILGPAEDAPPENDAVRVRRD